MKQVSTDGHWMDGWTANPQTSWLPTPNVGGCTVLYCSIWVDHRSRRRYDNPWSALRPVQVGPLCKAPSVCKVCVFIDGAWQLLVTADVALLVELGLYVYNTQCDSQFLVAQASMDHA